jgi:excinuclease ABC subunit A
MTLGLDYLTMGQPARSLSGGEAQRVRLAGVLAKARAGEGLSGTGRRSLIILDEPTAGLHPDEVPALIETLGELLDRGHSVVVVDNNPVMVQAADAVFRMTPVPGQPIGTGEWVKR